MSNKKPVHMRRSLGLSSISLAISLFLLLVSACAPQAMEQVNTVQVSLIEGEIVMPRSVPAGATTFEVTNNGTIVHNFEIEGQGLERVFETDLQPGETRSMTVDLQPGSYEVYCPVGDHAEQGMRLELTVTQP